MSKISFDLAYLYRAMLKYQGRVIQIMPGENYMIEAAISHKDYEEREMFLLEPEDLDDDDSRAHSTYIQLAAGPWVRN